MKTFFFSVFLLTLLAQVFLEQLFFLQATEFFPCHVPHKAWGGRLAPFEQQCKTTSEAIIYGKYSSFILFP
jgi:hypothetical protein